MSDVLHDGTNEGSSASGGMDLAGERHRIEKRHWWVRAYSIFVILLLTFAIISLSLPAVLQGAETFFRIRISEAVFGLIALIVLFNVYTVYQEILIRRLRLQLLEKQDHSDILRNLAMIDPLTGLYNRRYAEQRLAAEVARSKRRGHPLTVLTLDLNNFKEINDNHGHPAGDLVLQEFASRLNKVIRGSDLAARLGGDEFLVLLPDCTSDELDVVLNRLSSFDVDWQGQKILVQFSSGWKQYQPGDHPQELLAAADQALYAHKRASKTQTSASSDSHADSQATRKRHNAKLPASKLPA
jgi:diguanylate cyclase (GGDEF)-like protein